VRERREQRLAREHEPGIGAREDGGECPVDERLVDDAVDVVEAVPKHRDAHGDGEEKDRDGERHVPPGRRRGGRQPDARQNADGGERHDLDLLPLAVP
jgi:hypothetical protein